MPPTKRKRCGSCAKHTPIPVRQTTRTKKQRAKPQRKVSISDKDFALGRKKCRQLIKKLGLTIPTKPYDPFKVLHNNLSNKTKIIYREKWAEMSRFFYLIGCHQSAMLVDCKICPTEPLPFRPESYSLYLTYQFAKKGIPLINPTNGKPVKDINGKALRTVGGWNSPSSCYQIHAAVHYLHEIAYPTTCAGVYVQSCPECQHLNAALTTTVEEAQDFVTGDEFKKRENNEETCLFITSKYGFFKSCRTHANNPPLKSSGNVLNHPAAKNTYKAWLKLKHETHTVKGCGQLYPSKLQKLRTYLLLQGDPESIQMWIMILLGVRLFLRCDELISLDIDNFVNSYYPNSREECKGVTPPGGASALTKCQVVHPDSVEALVCKIKGKTDKKAFRLCLFKDDNQPEFDELRHLLWYIKMYNIKGGCLFPPPKMLEQGSKRPFSCSVHVSYDDFLKKFKKLVTDVLKRDETIFIVGTHTLRKTAYLMAIWGFYYSSNATSEVAMPCKYS